MDLIGIFAVIFCQNQTNRRHSKTNCYLAMYTINVNSFIPKSFLHKIGL
jgi:hypothetical protein